MALRIKDPEVDKLARELARQTGETITEAVIVALRERPARQRARRNAPARRAKLRSMRELPILDARTPDDIVGHDERED